jgi:hypothetical protein
MSKSKSRNESRKAFFKIQYGNKNVYSFIIVKTTNAFRCNTILYQYITDNLFV